MTPPEPKCDHELKLFPDRISCLHCPQEWYPHEGYCSSCSWRKTLCECDAPGFQTSPLSPDKREEKKVPFWKKKGFGSDCDCLTVPDGAAILSNPCHVCEKYGHGHCIHSAPDEPSPKDEDGEKCEHRWNTGSMFRWCDKCLVRDRAYEKEYLNPLDDKIVRRSELDTLLKELQEEMDDEIDRMQETVQQQRAEFSTLRVHDSLWVQGFMKRIVAYLSLPNMRGSRGEHIPQEELEAKLEEIRLYVEPPEGPQM